MSGQFEVGQEVEAKWGNREEKWFDGRIEADNGDGTYKIFWPEWKNYTDALPAASIRLVVEEPVNWTDGAEISIKYASDGIWYAGTIVQMEGMNAKVRYTQFGEGSDEVIENAASSDRIKGPSYHQKKKKPGNKRGWNQMGGGGGGGGQGGWGWNWGSQGGRGGWGGGGGGGGQPQCRTLLHSRHVGRIIGKGGEVIKQLKAESGAWLDFQQFQNPEERPRYCVATVSGSFQNIIRMLQLVCDRISECEQEDLSNEKKPCLQYDFESYLLVDDSHVGLIIGAGGATINGIKEETGADIQIGKECIGESTEKVVRVAGSSESCHAALETIATMTMKKGMYGGDNPYDPETHGCPRLFSWGRGGFKRRRIE